MLNVNKNFIKVTNLITRDSSKLNLKKLIFIVMNKMSEKKIRVQNNMWEYLFSCIIYLLFCFQFQFNTTQLV